MKRLDPQRDLPHLYDFVDVRQYLPTLFRLSWAIRLQAIGKIRDVQTLGVERFGRVMMMM